MTKKSKSTKDYTGQEFVITREFAAPRELVFQAWTEPEHLAQWWGPRGFTNPVCVWDARPGKTINVVMRAPNGAEYPMGGEFREIVPPEKLVFTCGPLDPGGKMIFEFLHDVTFTERKGKTLLTIKSRVLRTTPGSEKYIGGFEAGMTQSLERLADLLAQQTGPLIIERTLNAPVALVWKALTNKKEITQWSFEVKEFKPVVGFKFQLFAEKNGFKYIHNCEITAAVPNKKLAYTWRYEGYEGDSEVTFELFAEGKKTRLKLTHVGLETFPRIPAFARKNFVQGWTSITNSLKEHLEGDSSKREIVISRVVDAPRELVWRAMTEPEHVIQWWGPKGFTTTIEKMEVKKGGVWKHVMHGPDGADYPNKSVFTEVSKPERLCFSHGGARKGGGTNAEFDATWTFDTVESGKTKVTIRMVFPTAALRDKIVKEYGAIEGGKQTLERLAEYLPSMS